MLPRPRTDIIGDGAGEGFPDYSEVLGYFCDAFDWQVAKERKVGLHAIIMLLQQMPRGSKKADIKAVR